MALNDKQLRFVDEYPKDLNATQAAIRAGYAPGSAGVTGSRLLAHAKIKPEIAKMLAERQQAVMKEAELAILTRYQVLAEDTALATSDLTALIEQWTSLGPLWKNLKNLPPEIRRTIQKLKYDSDKGTLEIALHSKHPSLERLSKHYRLFDPREKSEDTDPESVPELALRAAAWLEGLAVKLHRPPEDITLAETVAMLREGAKRQRAVEEHAPAGE